MDKERIKGTLQDIKGRLKEGVGAATDDRSMQIDGKADRVSGGIRKEIGRTKDDVRTELNRTK